MQNLMVNFSIPKPLLRTIDGLAEEEMKTRSELVRDALREYLERKLTLKKRWEAIFAFGRKRGRAMRIRAEEIETLVDEYREGK